MERRFTTAVLTAIVATLSPSVSAQWPLYPIPGLPKGPDGKPDLTAPAPRGADGKPDLSGIWMIYNDPEPNGPPPGRPPLVRGGNAGAGFKEGLPFQPWAAELQKKRAAEIGLNDPDGLCLPQGPLQYHIDPQPLKIPQTPRQTFIIYESNHGFRTIYMDGRSATRPSHLMPDSNSPILRLVSSLTTPTLTFSLPAPPAYFAYAHFMDRDFGLFHVKLQTWFPLQIQVYVNGHEWLAGNCKRTD